jgi:hypothetical protein
MPGPALSPSEAFFVSQHEQTIDSIASDLTDLHHQLYTSTYSSLKVAEDAIIARIRPLANFTRDIEIDLHALSQQTQDLIYRGLPGVVADFEGEPIPVLFTRAERTRFTGALSNLNYQTNGNYALDVPHLSSYIHCNNRCCDDRLNRSYLQR